MGAFRFALWMVVAAYTVTCAAVCLAEALTIGSWELARQVGTLSEMGLYVAAATLLSLAVLPRAGWLALVTGAVLVITGHLPAALGALLWAVLTLALPRQAAAQATPTIAGADLAQELQLPEPGETHGAESEKQPFRFRRLRGQRRGKTAGVGV